ncbi:MAG: DUF2235 domain-containing protein [Jatrophihabitans sp.]|uniref:DUF2235 domain-containing protein n=1 Tax=Jatrophihabitans sp. TaxID=1932789 RepID=UPI003F812B55
MKNLIVCADGTWDKATDKYPSNVERLSREVAPTADGGVPQQVYYHAGVGTSFGDKFRGGLFGYGLGHNVRACYRFLVEHYEAGDRLFLFGFSRGAFTARSLAGFIRNAGVLRPEHVDRVDEGYDLYRDKEGPDAPSALEFRRQYAWTMQTPIHFVGVWDTVGALGVPNVGWPWVNWLNRRYQFHDTQLSSHVRFAYQALSIDEARRPFAPTLWQPQPAVPGQVVEQVWFAGVHTDVGGGYADGQLADITWHWMTDRARAAGLALREAHRPLDPSWANGPLHNSRTGIYKIVPPYVRPIGIVDPVHESLASTAAGREASDGWSPANVERYLHGTPRITAIE